MKRTIMIVLAVVMLISCAVGTALAASGETNLDTSVKAEILAPDLRRAVSFHVIDDDGISVADASLYLRLTSGETLMGVTDTKGNVVVPMFDGTHDYIVKKAGYANTLGSVLVAGSDVAHEVVLHKLRAVTFSVTDEAMMAIEGASVKSGTQEKTTDIAGTAVLSLPDGTHDYIVQKDGYVRKAGSVNVAGDTSVSVTLAAAARVEFTVMNDSNKPVASAKLTIDAKNVYTTDVFGKAVIWLAAADYNYTAEHPLHENTSGQFTVSNIGTSVNVSMLQKRYIADFYVTQADGASADAVINMNGQAVRTNSAGYAQITALLPGTYAYAIHKDGYIEKMGNAAVAANVIVNERIEIMPPTPTPTPTPTSTPPPTPTSTSTLMPTPTSTSMHTPTPTPTPTPIPTPPPIPTKAGVQKLPTTISSQAASGKEGVMLMDVGVHITYTDGKAVAGKQVELHSDVQVGRTNEDGWVLFKNVEKGAHTVFVKNDDGKIIGMASFELYEADKTDITLGKDGRVQIAVNANALNVAVDIEMDEKTGKAVVSAVREDCVPKGLTPAQRVAGEDEHNAEIILNNSLWYLIAAIAAVGIVILCIVLLRKRRKK